MSEVVTIAETPWMLLGAVVLWLLAELVRSRDWLPRGDSSK